MTNEDQQQSPYDIFQGQGEAEQFPEQQTTFYTTARAGWFPGFSVRVFDDDPEVSREKSRFFRYNGKDDPQKRQMALDAANAYIDAEGIKDGFKTDSDGNPARAKPKRAILCVIKGDNVPSSPEKRWEWGDSEEILSDWYKEANRSRIAEMDARNNTSVANDVPVGMFPQDQVSAALAGFPPNLRPLERLVWCKLERVEDLVKTSGGSMREVTERRNGEPVMVEEIGEDGQPTGEMIEKKIKVPRTFNLPVAVYASEEDAIADMDAPQASGDTKLSERAIKQWGSEANFMKQAATVESDIKALMLGKKPSFGDAPESKMSYEAAVEAVAKLNDVEVSDIEALGV